MSNNEDNNYSTSALALDNDDNVKFYPFCYKIKESCPPCDKSYSENCITLLANYNSILSSPFKSKNEKKIALMRVGNCLKKYGDMYKRVGIELYVNPKTKEIYFPDHDRIQANFNVFLNEIGSNNTIINSTSAAKNENERIEKLVIYQILLNDKLREVYNHFYKQQGFSELESIMPKEYGIARIMGSEKGGKKRKTKRKKNRKIKTKKNIHKNKK